MSRGINCLVVLGIAIQFFDNLAGTAIVAGSKSGFSQNGVECIADCGTVGFAIRI